MKNFIKQNIAGLIIGVLATLLAVSIYGVYEWQKRLDIIEQNALRGDTAYRCLDEGACAWNAINRYAETLKK